MLYGAVGARDAYDGPMLGVFWNTGDGDHGGDGDRQPVTVRGQSGVAAPITVFQQTVVPELGTVIAWSEGGRALGLYGRQWPLERGNELVSIADHLVTWREPDGLVVRILGTGVPLATARQVAERSRELTDEAWVALVEEDGRCGSN